MSTSNYIQLILNGTIQSLSTIIPFPVSVRQPMLIADSFVQEEIGVLIGLTGDLRGRLLVDSSRPIFSEIGSSMFGMPVANELLESFVGEFGNMLAGQVCTYSASNKLVLDITPPTVMEGNTKLFGFGKALKLPVDIQNIGTLTVVLALEED